MWISCALVKAVLIDVLSMHLGPGREPKVIEDWYLFLVEEPCEGLTASLSGRRVRAPNASERWGISFGVAVLYWVSFLVWSRLDLMTDFSAPTLCVWSRLDFIMDFSNHTFCVLPDESPAREGKTDCLAFGGGDAIRASRRTPSVVDSILEGRDLCRRV